MPATSSGCAGRGVEDAVGGSGRCPAAAPRPSPCAQSRGRRRGAARPRWGSSSRRCRSGRRSAARRPPSRWRRAPPPAPDGRDRHSPRSARPAPRATRQHAGVLARAVVVERRRAQPGARAALRAPRRWSAGARRIRDRRREADVAEERASRRRRGRPRRDARRRRAPAPRRSARTCRSAPEVTMASACIDLIAERGKTGRAMSPAEAMMLPVGVGDDEGAAMAVLDPVAAGLLDENGIGVHERKRPGDVLRGHQRAVKVNSVGGQSRRSVRGQVAWESAGVGGRAGIRCPSRRRGSGTWS